MWSNGEPFHPLWLSDEPNDGFGDYPEDCTAYRLRDGVIGYDDKACDTIYALLCERAPAGSS